ncbi:N-acetylglucosamine-6-phosphate deacetylase [subsurface metagenome]
MIKKRKENTKVLNRQKRIIILNGTIITPFNLLEDSMIVVRNGKIKTIKKREDFTIPSGAEIIEAKDKFVVPGYLDMHLHGGGGYDFMDGTYQAVQQIALTHTRFGTTALLPTTMTATRKQIIQSLKSIREAKLKGTEGAEILGVNLEGPYISPVKKRSAKRDKH